MTLPGAVWDEWHAWTNVDWMDRAQAAEERARLAEAVAVVVGQMEPRYQDLLASIWLYVGWRDLTRHLTTEQKELFADAVEAASQRTDAPVTVDRWWRA